MRTTLNLDDDVLSAVHERARREKRTAGEVASDLIRERGGRFATLDRTVALSASVDASEDHLVVL